MIRIIRSGRRWAKRQVFNRSGFGESVEPGARIYGRSGISIGQGTWVSRDATICAGSLGRGLHRDSQPPGTVCIGQQCEIHAGAILASYGGDLILGHNVSVNPYSVLYGHGGLRIGDDTRIAAHVSIVPANHRFSRCDVPIHQQGLDMRGIEIGPDVWIGTGVRILDGVRIGRGCVIAAGAVVRHDLPPRSIAAGVPARIIKERCEPIADPPDQLNQVRSNQVPTNNLQSN